MSEISVVVVGSTSISSVVGNGDTVNVNVGSQTVGGGNGAAATIEAGSVTTIDATQTATVTNVGTAYAAKFNFSLPRGLTGLTGQANSLSIGSVSTGATAAVSISGSAPSQALSFVLQPGPTGPANSLSIGSVSTGATAAVSISGSAPSQALSFVLPQGPAGPVSSLKIGTVVTGADAAATITGTAPTQTLNLVLPQGATGIQGPQGNVGPTGPANSLTVGSVTTTTATTASVSITGSAPSQQISFVIPQGPQGPQGAGGPFTTVQAGTVTTGAAGTSAKIDTVSSGGTVTLNFTIPRGVDGTANLADETPQPLGVASAGSAGFAARADHVHAVPTISYANLSGVPTTFAPAAHTQAISTVTGLQEALDGKQASGSYATLVSGQVPSSQLPSFVDDVIDVGGTLPASGDVGKIYVVSTGGSANKIYRWSGSTFIEISPSPGSTDSVTEGSTNLYFTNVRAAAAAPVQNVVGRTGAVTLAQLASTGTASSTTFLRGDGAWAAAGSTSASDLTTGTLSSDRLPLATTSVAGAVIVGAGLAISSGVLSASGSDAVDGGDYVGTLVYDRTITITQQPSDQLAVAGAATISVTATASPTGTLTYQWQRYQSSAWSNVSGGTSSSLALTGLTTANNGDRYRCVISAQSAASVTSGEAVIGVNATVPGVPTNLSAVRGDSSITLSWTAPASNGGLSITDYVVQYYAASGGVDWITVSDGTSTATSATITDLASGYYELRVAAVNAIGQGSYANMSGSVRFGPAFLAVTENTLSATVAGLGDSATPLVITRTSESQYGVVVISIANSSDTKGVDWSMQVVGGPVRFSGGVYNGLVVTSSYTGSLSLAPGYPMTIRPSSVPFSFTFTAQRAS